MLPWNRSLINSNHVIVVSAFCFCTFLKAQKLQGISVLARVTSEMKGALELAEGVCYPEARLVCGAWLSFGRGKRGRFHPQNFAKTRHFTRSDSSRFAF
jgi:hypothetical protein